MTISADQVRALASVLERIENGRAEMPRVPGPIGLFLRHFASMRENALAKFGIAEDGQAWISGNDLVPIELVPITGLEMRVKDQFRSSVSTAIATSETLGSTQRVTLWGGAIAADKLLRQWRRDPHSVACLKGPYRWHPPGRVTPGEAAVDLPGRNLTWRDARCLKYTGDDLGRAPLAAAFHLDLLTEPHGIKAFRTFPIRLDNGIWRVVPGLNPSPPETTIEVPTQFAGNEGGQFLVLAWAQAWEPSRWRVIAAETAGDDDILAHNIAWADHIRELRGEGPVTGEEMRALERRLRKAGLASASATSALEAAPLARRLSPHARPFASWLRGVT